MRLALFKAFHFFVVFDALDRLCQTAYPTVKMLTARAVFVAEPGIRLPLGRIERVLWITHVCCRVDLSRSWRICGPSPHMRTGEPCPDA